MRAGVLLLPLLLPSAGAQSAETQIHLAWAPEEPAPAFTADVALLVNYTWRGPAATLGATPIELRGRSSDAALNFTLNPATVYAPVDPTSMPLGGSETLNATLLLRWLFAPARGSTAELALGADAAENGNLPPAHAEATMTVRYPGPRDGPPGADDGVAARPQATPDAGAALALLALALAARRRI
jgi:hypothetical protein